MKKIEAGKKSLSQTKEGQEFELFWHWSKFVGRAVTWVWVDLVRLFELNLRNLLYVIWRFSPYWKSALYPAFEFHTYMVENLWHEFCMLIAGTLEKRIIDYKTVCTSIWSKLSDMRINDFLRKQCSKAKPVRFYVG